MKTFLSYDPSFVIKALSHVEGGHVAKPCPCGHRTCRHWHVYPNAALQGVSFTEEEAKAVAGLLNLFPK